ncbi:MAG: hypothetical protein M1817_002317 [Caeruleum heppii]|nr:MAG: hypothetical protein M1817_003498 [Caeruleum heppii]KAI9673679.1 MAG: hypothetical protein M1817_002317 [Caeruleum heppii]
MAILLTGGTGKTSTRIARRLQDEKIPFVLASRRAETQAPQGMPAAKLDWDDASTYENPFTHKDLNGQSISAVYLVAPDVEDPVPNMMAFIELAVKKYGVRRFVLLGGSSIEQGGPHVGQVWQRLVDMGLQYCVLLPTWFMENLTDQMFAVWIKNEGKIYTACRDGKIPFIAASDIAAVAVRALVDEKPQNKSLRVLGPELLTYDEVAAKLSSALGREIVHVRRSKEEMVQAYQSVGVPEWVANYLGYLENWTADGMEANYEETDAVEQLTGRRPQTLEAWVQENKAAWQ